MSLSGALSAAVSALTSQSTALAMVSNNLANSSTVGYKTSDASFQSLLADFTSSGGGASGGVSVSGTTNMSNQGMLSSSTVDTNMAIDGNGMFVVSDSVDGKSLSYTRDGEFDIDDNGYLVSNGYYLQGWPTDSDGNVIGGETAANLEAIDTDSISTIAAGTTEATLTANLPAEAATGDTFTSSMTVYDSLGTAGTTTITWTKTGDNSWTATFSDPVSASDTSKTIGTVTSDPVTITFNSDGTLASTDPSPATLTIGSWTTGATDSSIALDLGTAGKADGLTQYSSGEDTPGVDLDVDQNGLAFGSLSGITIGDDGAVIASYDNGAERTIYKIPVATFSNPDGLAAGSGGIYTATTASGAATLRISGENGAGTIYGSQLELSTTDTNEEFSKMMEAQQAYSGAAQVMSAANSMFETLITAVR